MEHVAEELRVRVENRVSAVLDRRRPPVPILSIARVQAWEVVVPARTGAVNSPEYGTFIGHEWDQWPICLLRIDFSDGSYGLGEAGRGLALSALASWIEDLVGRGVTAWNLTDPPLSWRPLSAYGGAVDEAHPAPLYSSPSPVQPALETALLDRAARALGCRAVELLGGPYREAVPVDYWCGRQTPSRLRETVAAAAARGFSGLKMKSRLGDPVVEQVQAIREVGGPGFQVTIDPMSQWFSPSESLGTFRELERFGTGVRVEDPFPEDRPEFWRRARATTTVPLVWHARTMSSLRRALQEECADAFNCVGGPRDFLTAAHAVEVAGYSCWRGSSLELGVAQAAGLHVAAASRACVLASDFQSALVREHTLVTWDWPYQNGALPLPSAPGLGVELDMHAVRHYLRHTLAWPA